MSQSVAKLKELLFDGETRALSDLARRIELVADSDARGRKELLAEFGRLLEARATELTQAGKANAVDIQRLAELSEMLKQRLNAQAASATRLTDDLSKRLDALHERAGTREGFEISVAEVLDRALHRAEVERHDAVAGAMAPLVVRTVKTEIRNSQDEIVEAIYPMTGRMVKAYVASAMADLLEQINRRLNSNPVMLRMRSITTGRPMAELALLETQRLRIEELYLIRRGTGELLCRWPEAPTQANRDQVMSGVLTAINDFASEAFKGEGTALRHVDLEASQVFLRASPTFLLAVRCSGQAHAAIERIIDDEFLEAIDRYQHMLDPGSATTTGGADAKPAHTVLPDLASRLSQRVDTKQDELARPMFGLSPVRLLALVIGLPLLLAIGWWGTEYFQTSRVRTVAQRVIDTSTEVKGYPISLDVEPWGRRLAVSGLAPTTSAREDLVKRLTDLLPSTVVDDQLSVVPTGGVDTTPQIAVVRGELARLKIDTQRMSLVRGFTRTLNQLEQVPADLDALARATNDPEAKALVGRAQATTAQVAADVRSLRERIVTMSRTDVDKLRDGLDHHARDLAAAAGSVMRVISGPPGAAGASPAPRPTAIGATTLEAAEGMATEADRLAATTLAAVQAQIAAKRFEPKPVPPPPPPPLPPQPSATERLADWSRTHAVFFANGTDYRDDSASAQLDAAANLIKEAGVVIRVIGYTDEQGATSHNVQLSQARARRVADDLIARGVAANKIVAIGRPGFEVSPTRGPRSANRRVEFQIGFEGEVVE